MYSFDASTMIHAWDNYPIENQHFKSLWDWFAEEVSQGRFVFSEVAYNEIKNKIPECEDWLKDNGVTTLPLSPDILYQAQAIKELLEIEEEQYSVGVGENDILIVSTAKVMNLPLISEESIQNNLPQNKAKYKIPAVCGMEEVAVVCKNFTTLLKE